jgi:MFS family permease
MMHLSPKRRKIFYGWWIVGACFLVMLFMGGFIGLGFTAFFEPIANHFGWSYTQMSLAASFRGVEVGLFAPLIGLLIDRWGPRRIMFGGLVLIGLGLVFLSRLNSLAMYYGGFAIIAIGDSGCSPTLVMTSIANWFRKRLGIAIGIMSSGFACGGLLVPLVVRLIDIFDWRTTLFILGLAMWIVCLPLSLILRHKPEQYGYLPDGEKSIVTAPAQVPVSMATREVEIETKQALRSRTFWHIGLAVMCQFAVASTVMVHVMPYLSSVGIPRSIASLVAMFVPLVSITGRLGSGWLLDRFDKKRVATGFFALMIVGLLCMSYISSESFWLVIPYIIIFGVGWGGGVTSRAALVSANFGRKKFGSILGFIMGMTALGGILGPLFAGWVFDTWASYRMAWLVLTVLIFAAMIVIATMPPVTTSVLVADKYESGTIQSG